LIMNVKCRAETADKDADTSAALVVIMFKQRIGVSDLLGESSRRLVGGFSAAFKVHYQLKSIIDVRSPRVCRTLARSGREN